MKRFFLITLLVFLPAISQGAGYVIASYADGGDLHEPSLGLELGGIFLSPLHPTGGAFSLGLGISVADTDEDPPRAEPLPVVVPAFDSRKEYKDGTEQEVYVSFGGELIPSFFAVGGIGYASQDVVDIGTSSGQRYKIGSDTDTNVTWMLCMRYVLEGLNMGIGYHSRRGVMASLGIAF